MQKFNELKELRATQRVAAQEQAAAIPIEPPDPWRPIIRTIRGQIDCKGVEQISTNQLLDILDVDMKDRIAGAHRRLSRAMTSEGWTPQRMISVTSRATLQQCRGYCRDARTEGANAPVTYATLQQAEPDTLQQAEQQAEAAGMG